MISASSEGKLPPCLFPLLLLLFPSLVPLFSPSLSLPLPTYSPSSLSNLFVLFPGRSLPPPRPLLFPFWLELSVPLLCPPSFPLPLLFSSLLNRSPSFLSLALRRGPSDSQMVKPKKKEGGTVGGFAIFLLSLSSVCVSVLAYVSSLPLSYVASKAAASDVR